MQHGPALIDGSFETRLTPTDAHAGGPGGGAESDIRLTLPADAGNVVLVRQVVAALAQTVGASLPLVEDVKLAVTEACTNVVRHAYDEAPGTMDVSVKPASESLTVEVADHGCGIRPKPEAHGAGLGIPLMAALCHALEIEQDPGCGSRVRMSFRLGG